MNENIVTTTTSTSEWVYNPSITVYPPVYPPIITQQQAGTWKWVPDDIWIGPIRNPWIQPRPANPWKKVQPKRRRAPVKKMKKSISSRRKGAKETYITLVLDRSSSMRCCYDAALDAINEQIDTIKANAHKGGKTFVSLVLFDHEVEVVFENESAKDLQHLNRDDYVIRGSTALRDAVMTAIDLMEEHEVGTKNQGFLVVLISDGQENSSGSTKEQLQGRMEELNESDAWTFTYMLDGHSWEQVQEWAQTYGTSIGNMSTYTSSETGTRSAAKGMSAAVCNYMDARNDGETKSEVFYNSGDGTECKS